MSFVAIDLKSVLLTVLMVFMIMMLALCIAFIKALFMFPKLRKEIWLGITNGDKVPHQEDFQKTSQLFFAYVFGIGLVICFILWAAFPDSEWHWITGGVAGVFLACIGLKSISFSKH